MSFWDVMDMAIYAMGVAGWLLLCIGVLMWLNGNLRFVNAEADRD